MYAVIRNGGKQYRVTPGDVIRVEKMEAEAGQTVDLNPVLMIGDDQGSRVGNPVLEGASVTATVKSHGRADKVKIFKMRRRKHYRKTTGHRQYYTELEITGIK